MSRKSRLSGGQCRTYLETGQGRGGLWLCPFQHVIEDTPSGRTGNILVTPSVSFERTKLAILAEEWAKGLLGKSLCNSVETWVKVRWAWATYLSQDPAPRRQLLRATVWFGGELRWEKGRTRNKSWKDGSKTPIITPKRTPLLDLKHPTMCNHCRTASPVYTVKAGALGQVDPLWQSCIYRALQGH